MGIHINLDVKFNKISNELWNDTFNEVLDFINKTPLGYRKFFTHNNKQFLVYSKPELLTDREGYEYISLSSDLNRLTHCESFQLYSNKDAYNFVNMDSGPEFEYNIWSSKTQRFSYHKYILATGMLLEHKLNGVAYVSGDITLEDIDAAKLLLKDTIGINVDTPERFESNNSIDEMVEFMSILGGRVGDRIVEKNDCMDFASYLIEKSINDESNLHDFSSDELRDIILDRSNYYNFTWSKEILDSIINTNNRDLLLGYTALFTVDCKNADIFEYICRFFKDLAIYSNYSDLLTSKIIKR